MGRPPLQGAPAFRFLPKEITEMERILEEHHGANPPRDTFSVLAEKFSNAPERAGKVGVQWKQIWNWFQNRRHAQRSKTSKAVSKPNQPSSALDDLSTKGTRASTSTTVSGKQEPDNENMDFEARSARDQAWYDVAGFLSYRCLQLDEPEVLVRFAGFGPEEDEWVNVKRSVRRRSLPCEIMECIAVLPGDLILCFQEGKEQALYYDAHILDVQRNRHDIRGCRCRFLVRYDHDKTEEIVPLRKVCRRPETDLRLQSVQEPKLSLPAALPALQEPKLSAPPTTAPLELKDSTLGTDQSDFGHANLAEVSTGIKISSEHGAEVSVPNEASAPNMAQESYLNSAFTPAEEGSPNMAQESYLNSAFTPAGEGSNNDRKHDQYDLNSIEKGNSALTTITPESTVPQVADIVRN